MELNQIEKYKKKMLMQKIVEISTKSQMLWLYIYIYIYES